MIRRSPAEYYLKYLVVHSDNYTNDRIKDIIYQLQLDYVGDWYVDQLRATCVPPTPFYPTDKLHAPSQRFLIKEKIQGLFLQDEASSSALKMMEKPRVKEFIEAMVLSGVPNPVIVYSLRTHRNFLCTIAALERYVHYFWNVELVDGVEIRALLKMRVDDVGKNPNPAIASQMTALSKAYYNDPRKVAADLPSSPLTAIFTQIRLGIMPSQVDLAKVLAMGQVVGSLRSVEAMLTGGPEDSNKALGYMTAAKAAAEMLESVVRPEDELQKKISKLVLKTDATPIPLLSEMSGGNHTVDTEIRQEAPNGSVVDERSEGDGPSAAGPVNEDPPVQEGGEPQ
jgi:hypothetical protein